MQNVGRKEEALTNAEELLKHLEIRKKANEDVEITKADIKKLKEYLPVFKHKQLTKQKKELKEQDKVYSKQLQVR